MHENLEGQKYIKCYKVRTPEKQLIFKLRSRMTNVKANFKSMYENLESNLCEKSTLQTDAHLLDCEALIQKCKTLANNYNAEYEDVFGNCDEQNRIAKLYREVFHAETDIQGSIASEEPQETNEVDIETETPKRKYSKAAKEKNLQVRRTAD